MPMRSWRVPTAVTMLAASAFLSLPLAAQTPPDAPSPPAPPQAEKGMNDDATSDVFLDRAKQAIAAGRIAAAQESLERAETRALARSVRPSQAREPSRQSLVQTLAKARQALAAGDRKLALQLIGEAQATEASEPD
jgi:hypothetical protein